MKSFYFRYRRFLPSILIGGLLGFLYSRFVGCSAGGCVISSNPWISATYGMLMGALFSDVIKSKKSEEKSITL
jgi:hypothetical protein